MRLGIRLLTAHRGPRLAYVMDVLTERYGWSWGYGSQGGVPPVPTADVTLVYGRVADRPVGAESASVDIEAARGILDAASGHTGPSPVWGHFAGVPCPAGADPLAGAFYCLGLLGDYGPRATDGHGRLPAATHPLYLRGLADVPVADRLLHALARALWQAAGLAGGPRPLPEASAATSDIDAPRALAHKPLLKRGTALARGVFGALRRPAPTVGDALGDVRDYLRGRADPFDTFAYMHHAAAARGLREDFFTLVGYGTRLDPGWRQGHPAWAAFWRKLPQTARLGIHPSYRASERPGLLRREVEHLRAVTGRPVVISRQHFLRLRIPDTFRALIACGIREDHSFMWADAEGFRAGTARSFRWYDLEREEATALRLFPPHAMDVTARYYGGLSPKQAIATWTRLAHEAEASGTALRCIWHNANLGPWHGWGPWREAYEASLDLSVIRERR